MCHPVKEFLAPVARYSRPEVGDQLRSIIGARGGMIKRSCYVEQMETTISEADAGSAIKMRGLRDLLHENTRTAGRRVSRMSNRRHVSVDKSFQHIIVGATVIFASTTLIAYYEPSSKKSLTAP